MDSAYPSGHCPDEATTLPSGCHQYQARFWSTRGGLTVGVRLGPTETLTFLFTDIEGSTALLIRLGDPLRIYRKALSEHHEMIRAALAARTAVRR